jgi:hypothetical protein
VTERMERQCRCKDAEVEAEAAFALGDGRGRIGRFVWSAAEEVGAAAKSRRRRRIAVQPKMAKRCDRHEAEWRVRTASLDNGVAEASRSSRGYCVLAAVVAAVAVVSLARSGASTPTANDLPKAILLWLHCFGPGEHPSLAKRRSSCA